MKLYLHFGAGNIGRALAGPVFRRAGYEVVFVDAAPALVEALQLRKQYRVVIKDTLPAGMPGQFDVGPVEGLAVHDVEAVTAAVARADLIGTAVGTAHLPGVLEAIAKGLPGRCGRPVSILFCENLHGVARMAREILAQHLPPDYPLKRQVGLVDTIIADRNGFVGSPPEGIAGLELKGCFTAYVERKLYVHNLGHAACACYGFLKGYRLISDAISDKEVLEQTRIVMLETAQALCRRYPGEFDEAGQRAHVEDLLRRFGNRALGDTVYRVGRDLPRKLAPGDRFIGGLRLVLAEGGDPLPLCRAIGAALCFAATDESGKAFPADVQFRERLRREGASALLCAHCGFEPRMDAFLLKRIMEAVDTLMRKYERQKNEYSLA
jgi:mannitol-1-phosphate 5-dehydrogenase